MYLNPRFQVHQDRKRCCCTCAFPAGHRCTASRKERRRTSASLLANLGRTWGNKRSTATTPRPRGRLWGEGRREGGGIVSHFHFKITSSAGSSHVSPSQQSQRKLFKVKWRPAQWKWARRYSSQCPSEWWRPPSLGWRSHGLTNVLWLRFIVTRMLNCSHK